MLKFRKGNRSVKRAITKSHILGTPGSPAIHGKHSISHPPEMFLPIRHKNPDFQVMVNHHRSSRTDPSTTACFLKGTLPQPELPLFLRQTDHNMSGHIGKNQLRCIPDIGIVGRKLPGSFLTD